MLNALSVLVNGVEKVNDFFDPAQLQEIRLECERLENRGTQLLREVGEQGLNRFYLSHSENLIVVPEAEEKNAICRFEQIVPESTLFRKQVVPQLKALLEAKIKSPVFLFKDKCNLKSPGAGAFKSHQDFPAYQMFNASIHYTVAIIVDDATIANGTLEFALNYQELNEKSQQISTPKGKQPLFEVYTGGADNGKIVEEVEQQLTWELFEAAAGDVILFDSYIPHRSEVNKTNSRRRMLFFTFNLAQEGDYYASYYEMKRADSLNPLFHVATPTKHSMIDEVQ